jgi:DNA-binding CsgD family transcriptional regulator
MNLSSKEIAGLLNTSVRSVETQRYRLRKKLSLSPEQDLVAWVIQV